MTYVREKKPSQVEKLESLMSDYQPHRTDEIVEKVYGPGLSLARVGARIYDLRKRLPDSLTIRGWHDKDNPALFWYQVVPCGQLTLGGNL